MYYKFNICPIKSYNIFGSGIRILFFCNGFYNYYKMSTISKSHQTAIEDFQSDFCPKCGALIDLDTLL